TLAARPAERGGGKIEQGRSVSSSRAPGVPVEGPAAAPRAARRPFWKTAPPAPVRAPRCPMPPGSTVVVQKSVVVQKYGGSAVATPEKIRRVAERVAGTRRAGHRVCVVVSAMGDTTDELLALAKRVSEKPQRRELDMLLTAGERISMALLSLALNDLGVD